MLKCLVVSFLIVVPAAPAWADSPLTSTVFWTVYVEREPKAWIRNLIREARGTVNLTPEMKGLLSNASVSNGAKLALINAIFHGGNAYTPGWVPGAAQYHDHLANRYGEIEARTDDSGAELVKGLIFGTTKFTYPEEPAPSELMSMGYLAALNRFDVPKGALPYLFGATQKSPRSLAARVALALAIGNMVVKTSDLADVTEYLPADERLRLPAQRLTEIQASFQNLPTQARLGYVYALFVPLIERRAEFDDDLDPRAMEAVMNYVALYKPDFVKARTERERLRQTLVKFGMTCAGLVEPPAPRWTEPLGPSPK